MDYDQRPETGYDEQLAAFCTGLDYEQLDDITIQRAKEFLLDATGIAIAAQRMSFSDVMLGAASQLGGIGPDAGESVIWGTNKRGTTEYAALLNGTGAHSLELDDIHGEAIVHPSVAVIPAVIAKAEKTGVGGEALVTGIVAGYEVMCRLGLALPAERHRQKGFHPTATCGLFGATAAIGTMMNLSPQTLYDAFGINASQIAGVLQWKTNAAWNKRIHPGLAARNAIFSVALAEQGFRGAADPITGKFGLLSAYSEDPRPERLVDGLGDSFEIERTGIKPYSCCRFNQTPIDATLALTEEHDIQPEDVESVVVESSKAVLELSKPTDRKSSPETRVDAQFSPQYAVAVAITDQKALLEQFLPERFNDPDIQDLTQKVTVVEDEDLTSRFPAELPARVKIETKQGTVSTERSVPKGDPDNRYSWDDLVQKFNNLTDPILDSTQQKQIRESVNEIESIDNINNFTNYLALE